MNRFYGQLNGIKGPFDFINESFEWCSGGILVIAMDGLISLLFWCKSLLNIIWNGIQANEAIKAITVTATLADVLFTSYIIVLKILKVATILVFQKTVSFFSHSELKFYLNTQTVFDFG